MLDPDFLDKTRSYGITIGSAIAKYAPKAEIWVGETAAAYHSGITVTYQLINSS